MTIITSHAYCDALVLYDTTERRVLRVCHELAGFGLTRLWNVQSLDQSRVAFFASGAATPPTVVVYDMRFGNVRSLCPTGGSGVPRLGGVA